MFIRSVGCNGLLGVNNSWHQSIGKFIFGSFPKKRNSFFDRVDVELSFKNVERDISAYVKGYIYRHARIKVLSMRESIGLEEVYTDSELILCRQDPNNFDSLEELNDKYQKTGDLLSINRENQERTSAIKFINQNPRVVVLGGAGAGKTTLLKKAGIEAWKKSSMPDSKKSMMPVFIELKKLTTLLEIDLEKEIIKEVENCGFRQRTDKLISRLLSKGKLLIILDGLDELPKEKRVQIIEIIQNFSDRYHENRFIVSCRVAAYQYKRFSNFRDVEIASFRSDQIRDAIRKWFGDDASRAMDCWQNLNAIENSDIRKLANTPLLLVMICIHYQQTGRFAVNRATLYEKALNIILEEWNAAKGFIPGRYSGLEIRQKEILLETIAYESFLEGRLFMYQSWMSRRIDELLGDMDTAFDVHGDKVIETIEIDHGLFLRQGDRIYSFSHATIQEFLVAEYLTKKNSRIKYVVDEKILSERWRDVFVFAAGFRQADDVLEALELKTEDFIQENPSAIWILRWVSRSTMTEYSTCKPVVKRIFALNIFLCMCLYAASSERLFQAILSSIRMCQLLIKTFEEDIPKSLRNELIQFERLIAMLITTRQSVSGYLYAVEARTANYKKVQNMRKHIMSICRHVEASTRIFGRNKVFSNVNHLRLVAQCKKIGFEVLNNQESSSSLISSSLSMKVCGTIFVECLQAIGLNIGHLEQLKSRSLQDFTDYLYCLTLLKDCSDTAKLFSKRRWADVENRMLYVHYSKS